MSKKILSKMYLADIIIENKWGYHYEALWYGSEPEHLAAMIMDVMGSWYEKNKDKLDPSIVSFHERLEAAVPEENSPEGEGPKDPISFIDLKGEQFDAGGLRLEVQLTNDLLEIFDFVSTQIYEIFMAEDKQAEEFDGLEELIRYMIDNYDLDDVFVNALTKPNEGSLSAALYLIDLKYNYTKRTFRQQHIEE